MEVRLRQGRRRNQLLGDIRENRGCWKLREEALDHTIWVTRLGRVYGPTV
jgi:hypothetical protein